MSCMYEYNQNPDGKGGFVLGQITSIKSVVRGCAAGSVWEDDSNGHVILTSRTAESLGSVWRKVPSAPPLPRTLLRPLPFLPLPSPPPLLPVHPQQHPMSTSAASAPSPHPTARRRRAAAPPQRSRHTVGAGERVGAGVV